MELPTAGTFCPASREDWRNWLQENHRSAPSVWLIYYKKHTQVASIAYSDAVDEALCFGWIDSTARPIDQERYMQFFTRRKPTSVWSKVNKAKVARLIAEGRMQPAGLESIEVAKQNGSWTILDDVEEGIIPDDLTALFARYAGSEAYFLSRSNSQRKAVLQWLVLAKRPETRQKRLEAIASCAAAGQLPPPFSR